jgi:hypothetical protein
LPLLGDKVIADAGGNAMELFTVDITSDKIERPLNRVRIDKPEESNWFDPRLIINQR